MPSSKRSSKTRRTRSARSRTAKPGRSVYFFGAGRADGRAGMREVLGGKGAGLAEMSRIGLPVPAGFTIGTAICAEYNAGGKRIPQRVRREVLAALAKVEKVMGGRFGYPDQPLLVSVRSGARASMPGMMDTVLNLGLNDATVHGLIAQSGDERFAWDSYRRFIHMYGDVVLGVEHELFEKALSQVKHSRGVQTDAQLLTGDLRDLVGDYKRIVRESTGRDFPADPLEQLWGAISAVFDSWQAPRAVTYRKLHDIPAWWGTAVNVQAMVFGNLGEDSATGVAFTRDPSTGEKRFYGEFLPKAQGEDVVAGIRTPQPILRAERKPGGEASLEELLPGCYKQLRQVAARLERHYRDMQDLEFTIQNGKLWMLQTRTGKRTARSAVRIAVEMARERLISREEAVLRVDANQLDRLLHPALDEKQAPPPLATGLPASPGAVSGKVVFSAEAAEQAKAGGERVILVRRETSPEDIGGMHAAEGILTALGGMTSHAAVVARGMGKCCVAGCGALSIEHSSGRASIAGQPLAEGELITLDGSTGKVYRGEVPTIPAELGKEFQILMGWADKSRRLAVRANADTPEDALQAVHFGAQGIGLCRTEHMFFAPERLLAVRRMIVARSSEERAKALAEILPMQRADFVGIFRVLAGRPCTIRLLDPPLHEFVPHEDEEVAELARELGVDESALRSKVASLHEFNPMLGHRGCRLAITFPEIYAMQVRAILEAALACSEQGVKVLPEIMIPLALGREELALLRELVEATAREVLGKKRLPFAIGTMIEVPRAALLADRIATVVEFFSFGTNDLTQTALALSRDDAGKFLPEYVERELLPADPFVSLDQAGVGQLIEIAVARGRKTRRDLKLGICGEHGGDPASIRFCERVGLDYVSCSPFRVPIARLAAAQAALGKGE